MMQNGALVKRIDACVFNFLGEFPNEWMNKWITIRWKLPMHEGMHFFCPSRQMPFELFLYTVW